MIAAIFVQEDGCYFGMNDVDPWPESRDARLYDGPHPVVAHPPCQLWGALACVNYARWGGEHNKPGNDGGCFQSALDSVNLWGGVLEHPAKTRAFAAHVLISQKAKVGASLERGGFARFGSLPMDIGRTNPHGCITRDLRRHLSLTGVAPEDRIRWDFRISAARVETSRHSASVRPMPRQLSFAIS